MMWRLFAGLCIGLYALIVAGDIALDAHCTGKANGNYDLACKAYITCTDGKAQQFLCVNGQVYNHNTGKCDDPINSPLPCGLLRDCSHKENGRYADIERKCRFYYTCNGGQFLGHNECPGTLVFNETMGICNWPINVYPPCGTKL